jgi:hypothetical protein
MKDSMNSSIVFFLTVILNYKHIMKNLIFLLALLVLLMPSVYAQTKKDGTPDMRYKANKESYGESYSSPIRTNDYSAPSHTTPNKERHYENGGELRLQNGYLRRNGPYVAPHYKTKPDNNKLNNLSNDE